MGLAQKEKYRSMDYIHIIYIYTHIPELYIFYSARKKNKIMPFAATWMQTEIIILSEVSQKEKDKYHVISLIFWNLIYGTNEPFHRKQSHGLGEKTCGCKGEEEGTGWTENLGLIDADYCLWNG